jgi:hypothetical protein
VQAEAAGVPNAGQPVMVQPVTNFRDLMTKINRAMADGKLKQEQLAEACRTVGADSITALAAQPMKVPEVDQYLNKFLAA